MGNTVSDMQLTTILPPIAVFSSGVTTGFLSGASFLDCRTFKALVAKKDADTIRKVFPIWWPHGKSFMVPMTILNCIVHFGTFAVTNEKLWILTGSVLTSIGPYTGMVMMKNINTLRGEDGKVSDDDVLIFTKTFCKLHHPRLALALIGFGTSIYLVTRR